MKFNITEQTILFFSIIKWVFLATIIGVIVGLSTTMFLKLLNLSTSSLSEVPYVLFLLPLALFLSSLIVKYLAPDAEGHGTEKVIEAVHQRSGKIRAVVVPVKLVATVITLAAGGSAGKEGPCAQIGAGLSSVFADVFRFDDKDRKKLVICGVSAGFASVFGTPIAGSIFGVEVLFVGAILYDVLLPSFIAGIIGYQVSSAMGMTYFYHPVTVVPGFTEQYLLTVVLAGVFFGFCSMFLIEMLKYGETLSARLKVWKPVKGLIGGAVLVGIALLFSTQFLGLGLDTIESCLMGAEMPWYAFPVKIATTSITLAFGGSGGIVTPIFFVGATAGVLFGTILGVNTATFSAIGMVSLLAGAANTPIAASILAVELFGPKVAPYATVACVISFLMTGHRSVYPSQVLSITKSPSIQVELGQEMDDVKATYHPRRRTLFVKILQLVKKFEDIMRRER